MQQEMSWKETLLFWLGGLTLFITFLVLIKSILLPFVVAIITGYFLDPVADKLESWGLSRTLATLVIVITFFALVITVSALLVPVLYNQLVTLLGKIPEYTAHFQEQVLPRITEYIGHINPESLEKAKNALSNTSGTIFSFITKFMANILQSTLAIVNLLMLLFITPIVTYYFLHDWDTIIAKINSWLPPASAPTIREQARLIDRALSGYIRGQTNVCLILGIFYAIGLSLTQLEFGLFIGLCTGLLTFIPYVGILFGIITASIVAFFQFGDALHIGLVLGVFGIGQVIEGSFITPKLVGNKVGLHPVWIIFGMLAGAALFNFLGILLAVPVTAIIAVLVRFGLKKYLGSKFYSNHSPLLKNAQDVEI